LSANNDPDAVKAVMKKNLFEWARFQTALLAIKGF